MRKKTDRTSLFKGLTGLALGALRDLGLFRDQAERTFKDQKIKLQRWLIKTVVLALSIFLSLTFFILGLFFMAMDYGGYSRGIVFTVGGALGLLILGWKVSTAE